MNHSVERKGQVAAFFDLDGTLLPGPSLEWRFFRLLRYRHAIPARNYLLWFKEALRLAPQGFRAMRHANKMYLRGVTTGEVDRQTSGISFFPGGLERLAWHATQGHQVVIVSGTLESLARHAAIGLETEMEARGLSAEIAVCSTRLEECDAKWTGRIVGEAMHGEAKARAVRKLAKDRGIDLTKSYAYGDTVNDQSLLAAVGRPAAVNPSREFLEMAERKDWPGLTWEKVAEREATFGARVSKPHGRGEDEEAVARTASAA